jgi:hypothetical protein
MPKVTTVRTMKPSALRKPPVLLEIASNMAMGVAMGLAFALVLTHITALAIATLIDQSPDPDTTMMAIVCAFASVGGLLGSCVRVRGEE